MQRVRSFSCRVNVLALAASLFCGSLSEAGDWPGWRGPKGNGVSDEQQLPQRWSASEGIRWKTELPGMGVSTPIVWEDRVFVTASSGNRHDELHILCLDRRDGGVLWQRRFWGSAPTLFFQGRSSMATPTPVTDGEHVWAFFGTGDFFCLDREGELVWCRSLVQEYEPFQNRFGMSSSPVLAEGRIILQCDHWGQSYLIALDPSTGKNVWKSDRAEHLSWTTPLVTDVGGRKELVVCGPYQVKGYDPASGRERWVVRGLTRDSVPTAVTGAGLIFVVSGPGGATLAIRPGGQGDITETHVVWQSRRAAPFVPSPLFLDDLYYMVNDKGIATCLDAKTGERVWQKRLGKAFTASPIAADGKLYFIDEEGVTTVLRAGAAAEVLSQNPLEEGVLASPAVARGEIFIRGMKYLYCIGGTNASTAQSEP